MNYNNSTRFALGGIQILDQDHLDFATGNLAEVLEKRKRAGIDAPPKKEIRSSLTIYSTNSPSSTTFGIGKLSAEDWVNEFNAKWTRLKWLIDTSHPEDIKRVEVGQLITMLLNKPGVLTEKESQLLDKMQGMWDELIHISSRNRRRKGGNLFHKNSHLLRSAPPADKSDDILTDFPFGDGEHKDKQHWYSDQLHPVVDRQIKEVKEKKIA